MNFFKKLKTYFPSLGICIYYFLSSLSFCYLYFHKIYFKTDFHDKSMGGIYYILSFEANKPNQYRLFVPLIFKFIKLLFSFLSDRVVYFSITLSFTFLILLIFYNILNVYFQNRGTNQWLALCIFYPMVWQYLILNQMFEFTDFANLLFILLGFYFIIKKYINLLLVTFLLGTFNHDSVGFLVIMYILFNIKDIFKKKKLLYIILMSITFILVKKLMEYIFIANQGISFRMNIENNLLQFVEGPIHRELRNIFLFFGGLHIFVLYFFISGKWKMFKTNYLYLNLTIIFYIIIIFLIHTIFEARNYIVAIPFILILFLMFFSTQKDSFLKPRDEILTGYQPTET